MVSNFFKTPISPRTLALRLSYVEISNFFRASGAVNVSGVGLRARRPSIHYQTSSTAFRHGFKRAFSQLRSLRSDPVEIESGFISSFKGSCEFVAHLLNRKSNTVAQTTLLRQLMR